MYAVFWLATLLTIYFVVDGWVAEHYAEVPMKQKFFRNNLKI